MKNNEAKSISHSTDDAFYQEVYGELRRIANGQMRKAWSLGTMSATALVSEAYLKLVNVHEEKIESRSHFFAIAATAMRQIIINYAEQKNAQKRGSSLMRVTYDESFYEDEVDTNLLLDINESLEEIRSLDEKLAKLVELRFFAGMSEKEIADVFHQSERTVRRNWQKAKMLLRVSLQQRH